MEQNKGPAAGKASTTAEAKSAEAAPAERPAAKSGPEQKPRTEPKPRPAVSARRLAPASESSDPAVHQLLAEQDIARLNDNEDEVKRTQDALAELGYE
jgi:hypothetical protein